MESTAHNGALFARQEVNGLKRENAMLRARIAKLERIGEGLTPGNARLFCHLMQRP